MTRHINNYVVAAIMTIVILSYTTFIFYSAKLSIIYSFIFLVQAFLVLAMTSRVLLVYFFIALLFFSNIFISLVSPALNSFELKLLLGVDFLLLILISLNEFIQNRAKLNKLLLFPLAFILIYFVYGVINNGFIAASIYVRLLSYALLAFYIGGSVGSKIDDPIFRKIILSLGVLFLIYVFAEFFYTASIYSLINADTFFNLKYPLKEIVNVDDVIEINTRRLFNTQYFPDIYVLRPVGLLLHSISTAYVFAIFFSLSLYWRKCFFAFLFAVAVLIMGSKGALALIIIVFAYELLKKINAFTPVSLLLGLCIYVIASGFISYYNNDPHIFSILSTLYHLPSNLLGQGVGYGGSIVMGYNSELSLDFINGDSAFAVILNMMGLFGIVVYAFYFIIIKKLFILYHQKQRNISILLTSLAALMANSIFQEEAFSPYSLGFLMFMIGVLHYKDLMEDSVNKHRDKSQHITLEKR